MKNLIYIFFLFFCQLLFGQIEDFNNLCTNNTNIQLSNKYFTQKFKTPGGICSREDFDSYKSVNYYKIVSGGTFEFSMTATKAVNFHVWILNETEINSFFESNESKLPAVRSSYQDKNSTNIGLFSSSVDECEFYNYNNNSADGKLKPINVNAGQYVVIGVLSDDINTTFSITPGGSATVCEDEPTRANLTLDNNKCIDKYYTYNEVIDFVKDKSSLNDILLYSDENLQNQIPNTFNFGNNHPIIYAVVKNPNGIIKFIYSIKFVFQSDHQFSFKSNFQPYFICNNEFVIPSNEEILNRLFDNVLSTYSISSISINGINYNSGDKAPITQSTEIKVKVLYNGECSKPSEEKSISLISNIPNLENSDEKFICGDEYIVDFDEIFTMISKDKNQFDLIVKYNGNRISNGTRLPITNQLNFKLSIKSKSDGFCESNEVDFVVNKTLPANIIDAEIKDYCVNDYNFTPTLVGAAVNRIQNGNSYTLKYYKEDGSVISMDQIYDYMKEILVGKVIVKALAADNPGICDTEVELKFDIKSGFQWKNTIPNISKNCLAVNDSGIFTKEEIEKHLKNVFRIQDLIFEGISDEKVNSNSTKTIQFRVKQPNGCWSDLLNLNLIVSNLPNFTTKTDSQFYCEGDQITFDYNYFGIEKEDYLVKVNDREIDFSETLNFGSSTIKNYRLTISNRSTGCSTIVDLIIKKKNDIPDIYKNRPPYKVPFCRGDGESIVEQKIKNIIDEINDEIDFVPTLSASEIYTKYKEGNRTVEVNFVNNKFCGELKVIIEFDELEKPSIELPTIPQVCSDNYLFDLKKIEDYERYDFILRNDTGKVLSDLNLTYDLSLGNYQLEVKFNGSECFTTYPIEIKSAPTPIIEKIIISNKEIIVQAKGEGLLEYALFDEYDNLLIGWQTNNALEFPSNGNNKRFEVKVRLNNCGITERSGVNILNIPNFISPNGDGFNDEFIIVDTKEYKIQIFDRYGMIVFEKEGESIIRWNGTKNGKVIPTDTYWYTIKPLKSSIDLQVQYSGSILVKQK